MGAAENKRNGKRRWPAALALLLALGVACGAAAWWLLARGEHAEPPAEAGAESSAKLPVDSLLIPSNAVLTRVLDATTKEPLSSCEMKLSTALREEWVSYETTDGLLTIAHAAHASEPITLEVRAPGYCANEIKILYSNLPQPMRKLPFEVLLHPLRPGHGYVTGKASGKPIEDMYVRLLGEGAPVVRGRMYRPDRVTLDRTDADGHFYLAGLASAPAKHLLLWHPDYPMHVISGFNPDEQPVHRIAVGKGGALSVRLHNEGAPPAGLAPELWYIPGRGIPAVPVPDPIIMDEGRFDVAPLAPGSYAIRFILAEDGSEWGRAPVVVAEGNVTRQEWDLTRFGGIWGIVHNTARVAVREVEVALANHADCPIYSVELQGVPEFEFGFLPSGAYVVSVWPEEGETPFRKPHNVRPGEWSEVHVQATD